MCVVGSRAESDEVHVHKAVGDSLDLIANYTKEGLEVKWKYNDDVLAEYDKDQMNLVKSQLFPKRLKMYKDNISITIEDLKLQDSGRFSIVVEKNSDQCPTKVFVLHVHGEFNFILSMLLGCKHTNIQELELNKSIVI